MEGGPQEDWGDAPPQAWNPSLEQCAQQSLGSFCRISLPSWGVALTLASKMASYIGYLCQEEVRRKASSLSDLTQRHVQVSSLAGQNMISDWEPAGLTSQKKLGSI